MIIYTIGKRIKNFFKVKISSRSFSERVVHRKGTITDESAHTELRTEIWYFNNGKVKAELSYRYNKLEGISTFYYESGQIKAKENYKDGILEGLTKRYYETGALQSEEYYKRGTVLFRRLFSLNGSMTKEENLQ